MNYILFGLCLLLAVGCLCLAAWVGRLLNSRARLRRSLTLLALRQHRRTPYDLQPLLEADLSEVEHLVHTLETERRIRRAGRSPILQGGRAFHFYATDHRGVDEVATLVRSPD